MNNIGDFITIKDSRPKHSKIIFLLEATRDGK